MKDRPCDSCGNPNIGQCASCGHFNVEPSLPPSVEEKEKEQVTHMDSSKVIREAAATASSNEADPPSWCECVTECCFAVTEVQGRAAAGCLKHFNAGDEWLLRRKVLRAINALRQWSTVPKAFVTGHTLSSLATLLADIDDVIVEAHDTDVLNTKLADTLTRTANALKGEPEPLHLHSWHDLPEVAATLRNCADAGRTPSAWQRAGIRNDCDWDWAGHHDAENCRRCLREVLAPLRRELAARVPAQPEPPQHGEHVPIEIEMGEVLAVAPETITGILTKRFSRGTPGSGLVLSCYEAHTLMSLLHERARVPAQPEGWWDIDKGLKYNPERPIRCVDCGVIGAFPKRCDACCVGASGSETSTPPQPSVFHWKDGWFFLRVWTRGGEAIRIEKHTGPSENAPIVVEALIPMAEWLSIIASAARVPAQPESEEPDEEMVPHAFVALAGRSRGPNNDECWCVHCEYHRDHQIHQAARVPAQPEPTQ